MSLYNTSNNEQATDTNIQALLDSLAALNDTMLYTLTAILEKMPRLDRTDRMTIDIDGYAIGGSTTATLSTNAVSNPTTGSTFYRINEPTNFSDMGSSRLYQQIIVS